jgi:hypothetical protein
VAPGHDCSRLLALQLVFSVDSQQIELRRHLEQRLVRQGSSTACSRITFGQPGPYRALNATPGACVMPSVGHRRAVASCNTITAARHVVAAVTEFS